MKSLNLTNIEVTLAFGASTYGVRWTGEDGNRYHYWSCTEDLQPQDDILYKNPPLGVKYRGEDYFDTRKLSISAHKNHVTVTQVIAHCEMEGLLAKARAAHKAERIAEIEKNRAEAIASCKHAHGVELYNTLATMVAAQRRATSQHSLDGLADSAEALLSKVDAEIAEINARYDGYVAREG